MPQYAAGMGYELESPWLDACAAGAGLRYVEHAVVDAHRRLNDAVANSRGLLGLVECDDPIWLAAQIRVAEARLRYREATDALADLGIDPAG